jgi:hypothetical protein
MYAQLINDETGTTLVGLDTRKVKGNTALIRAKEAGRMLAVEKQRRRELSALSLIVVVSNIREQSLHLQRVREKEVLHFK